MLKSPHHITIRNYMDKDADKIAKIDFMSMLAYHFNGDYEPENIFCAVESEDHIYGVVHIVPDSTWSVIENNNMSADYVHKLNLDISLNEELTSSENIQADLLICLLKRAKELREKYPEKKSE